MLLCVDMFTSERIVLQRPPALFPPDGEILNISNIFIGRTDYQIHHPFSYNLWAGCGGFADEDSLRAHQQTHHPLLTSRNKNSRVKMSLKIFQGDEHFACFYIKESSIRDALRFSFGNNKLRSEELPYRGSTKED